MRPLGHAVVSVAGAGLLYVFFRNALASFAFAVSSVLIDLDHFFDYFYERGFKDFTFGSLCNFCYHYGTKRLTFIFHSFELIFVLWFIVSFYKLNIIWISFVLGLTLHLIIDQLANHSFPFTYFFIYRWFNRFQSNRLFPKR